MRPLLAVLTALTLAAAFPAAHAQNDASSIRERAIAKCNANRGVDCGTAEGLKEWIDREKPRPPRQKSAIQLQKLEAQRRAQAAKAAGK